MSDGPLETLTAGDGTAVRYERDARDGRDLAFELHVLPGADLDKAAELVAERLSGWLVMTSPALARLLVHRGATIRRHALAMHRELQADPPPAQWRSVTAPARIAPVDKAPEALVRAVVAAYRPGHPDRLSDQDTLALLGRLLGGTEVGPLMSCSRLAVGEDGVVLGGVLVNDWAGREPWITEVFRDPAHPGLGAILLRRVIAAAADDGHRSIGLAVTAGNPAMGLYERLGFAAGEAWVTLSMP